jgi:N-succinyldiaminopimelate aminotransferase
MNPDLEKLLPYPFERLAALKDGVIPPAGLEHIALSVGEPKHAAPQWLTEEVLSHLHGLSVYPTTRGSKTLRTAICDWLTARFALPPASLDPDANALPVNGTREALFAFAQAAVDRGAAVGRSLPLVLMPNPFYQIYEGAALLAGAEPGYLPCLPEHGFVPDFDAVAADTWRRCQLLYLCSPGNPSGATLSAATFQRLLGLADEYDFVIASDECYCELYHDEANPPVGLLQAAAAMGRTDYRRCLVFHSLSKRSNAPGLRSGFVAGDAGLIASFLRYRTYHGCAMPPAHQAASVKAWLDEAHVRQNRTLYRRKFDAVLEILGERLAVERPAGGFYLWPETPVPDTEFARELFARQNVTVLPGSYLSREVDGLDPGRNRIRIALVAPLDECVEAAQRMRDYIDRL